MQLSQYLEHPVNNGRSVSGGYVSLSGHVSGTWLVLHLKSEVLLVYYEMRLLLFNSKTL